MFGTTADEAPPSSLNLTVAEVDRRPQDADALRHRHLDVERDRPVDSRVCGVGVTTIVGLGTGITVTDVDTDTVFPQASVRTADTVNESASLIDVRHSRCTSNRAKHGAVAVAPGHADVPDGARAGRHRHRKLEDSGEADTGRRIGRRRDEDRRRDGDLHFHRVADCGPLDEPVPGVVPPLPGYRARGRRCGGRRRPDRGRHVRLLAGREHGRCDAVGVGRHDGRRQGSRGRGKADRGRPEQVPVDVENGRRNRRGSSRVRNRRRRGVDAHTARGSGPNRDAHGAFGGRRSAPELAMITAVPFADPEWNLTIVRPLMSVRASTGSMDPSVVVKMMSVPL